ESDVGIRTKLRNAAAEVERIVNLDISYLPDDTTHRLIQSLLSMRRFEAAYMRDRDFNDRAAFNAEFGKFNKILDGVETSDAVKTQVRQTVRAYADAFETWLASDGEIASRVAGIDSDAQFLIRSADANVIRSNEQRNLAAAA